MDTVRPDSSQSRQTSPAGPAPFGALLRRYRLAAGLTQEELAERAGLSVQGLSALENRRRQTPYRHTVALLAQALDLDDAQRAALEAAVARRRGSAGGVPVGKTAALGALPTLPRLLPVPMTALIGRAAEASTLHARLGEPTTRLLTLTGPGGVGKTRLAVHVATAAMPEVADSVVFVALASLRDPALVPSIIAAAIGVAEPGGVPLMDALVAALRPRRVLLVLDNFEHLLAAAPVVATLLGACPLLRVMVTSRAALRIYGEQEYPVPPLAVPAAVRAPPLADLMQCAAVTLFVQRARAVKPDFQLTAHNAEAVADLCRRLDGLPLALELAAARVRVLPPAQLVAAWSRRRLQVLAGGARDLPERQQTMRATIAWSYELLPPPEQALFRRLAVFAGGFTFEAMESICQAGAGPGGDLLELLDSLLDKSLVRQEEHDDGDVRFAMLETVREYALEQLGAGGEAALLREQHAAYFLALAETAQPYLEGSEQTRWLDSLEREHDNLRAALQWSAHSGSSGNVERGLRGAAALWLFWLMRGHLSEGRARLAELLALPGAAAPGAARADALNTAGALARYQGDFAAAAPLIVEGLAIRRALGNLHGTADSLANLGYVALYQGDDAQARALYEEGLAIYRMAGNAQGMADTLSHLGVLALYRDDRIAARALHEESLALWRQSEDGLGIAWAVSQLGKVALHETDNAAAADLFRASLLQHRDLGDQWGMAEALEGLACVAAAMGRTISALHLAGAAAMLRTRLGTALPLAGQADLERRLAPVHQALGSAAATAWAEGQRLTVEQALAEALAVADN